MTSIQELRATLHSLLEKKQGGMRVDNDVHNCAVKLARELLAVRFPDLRWKSVAGANLPGIDIVGFRGTVLEVACEVKGHDQYKGNRRSNIDQALRRLQECTAQYRFLAVCYSELERGLRNSRTSSELLSGVHVLNLILEPS